MTFPARPAVDCEIVHAELNVADVQAATDFYVSKLGFTLGFLWGDPPERSGVNLGNVQIHLCRGTPPPDGSAAYFVVGDADELFEFQRAGGVEIARPPADRPWGLRDYRVRDLDGNLLGFGHYLNTTEPALPIERVDVSVRLEKRLAALLEDLAGHKGMGLGSCLEETLLHTFEPMGQGVASPHTKGTLRHIEELKSKHGIDYDCHASYRFVEHR